MERVLVAGGMPLSKALLPNDAHWVLWNGCPLLLAYFLIIYALLCVTWKCGLNA